MTRADALGRYRALPLPTTKDEHWRFTNLAGFDPDAWSADGATQIASPPTMLELDASGIAYVGEAGIEVVSAPDGIRFEPSVGGPRAPLFARRVGREVRGAQRRDVAERAPRPRPEGRPAREAALRPHRELGRRRLALLAAPRRRRAREPVHADRGVRVRDAGAAGVFERRSRDRRPASGEGRVRLACRTSPAPRGTSARTTRASSVTPSSTGWPVDSARPRARCGSRTTSPARARRPA